jgi:hypothetical protein
MDGGGTTMKNLLPAVLLFSLALACSHRASGADKKNDPSNFPLAVHISASSYGPYVTQDALRSDSFIKQSEVITATINGKHYQLSGPTSDPKLTPCCNGLLNPGDYRTRLVQDEHRTSYESRQAFELLFPDGSTRRFDVIAQSE